MNNRPQTKSNINDEDL